MPSFDTVSEIDHHELSNAVDQANREIGTRYDFKGSDARIELSGNDLMLHAQSEFQLQQMMPILQQKMAKRGLDIICLKPGDVVEANNKARQPIKVQEGIDTDLARKIVKLVKEAKMKVQAQIQGEQVRITGKKRDDLQQAIQLIKEANLGIPLQFINFRD